MKAKLALFLSAFVALSGFAQLAVDTPPPSGPPDKVKLSYAMGMNLGLQRKQSNSDADVDTFLKGLTDVMEKKQTEVQEADLPTILSQERLHEADTNQPAPDKTKYTYALGMRLAIQIKRTGMELDPAIISQALHDVLDGKPTKIQESEIAPLFKQAQAYEVSRKSNKNVVEGKAFLAKNKEDKTITVLPDGLQYKVIHEGTGEIPKTNDYVELSYVGTTIDGREVESRSHVTVSAAAPIMGFREALAKMKVGSKWKLFIPPDLAYGQNGLVQFEIGPGTTLVYELELNGITPADKVAHQPGLGRMGHGLHGYARPGAAGEDTIIPDSQTNGSISKPVIKDDKLTR
jgi:FKBP-type peptidyl-prolyl cis-trans isomerase